MGAHSHWPRALGETFSAAHTADPKTRGNSRLQPPPTPQSCEVLHEFMQVWFELNGEANA